MKIWWSPLAVGRLEEIVDYIVKDNSSAAQKFVKNIFKKIETLSKYPQIERKVPEATREVFEREYRIIYRVETKKIVILSIRNFKQLFPGEDIE